MAAFELRWGIISTGNIAKAFVKDILVDPKTRDVEDVAHKIVAVASRSTEKAQEFVDNVIGADLAGGVKAYGSYEELYADQNVDAVYIGTPHTHHYTNALSAIQARKNVLCEKPVTTNAAELRGLLKAAEDNGVFFMEAMWTRFQPLVREVKRVIDAGNIGDPVVLHADLSGDFDLANISKEHRILDPKLGGGALLDLMPYPLVWAILALYEHPKNASAKPSTITASMIKTPLTGVDCNTVITLNFGSSSESTLSAQAILSTSINVSAPAPGVLVRFTSGAQLEVYPPIYSPREFILRHNDGRVDSKKVEYVGKGWHFQADEVARCIRDGKKQSEIWSWEKSLLQMDIFDEARKQGGYVLPPGVEKVV